MALRASFVLDIVKPDGQVLSTEVDEVVVPGEAGSFGILAGHTPFIAQVGVGEIMYRIGKERHYLAVDGGFCEVRPHRVTVLAERAERAEEIDQTRAGRLMARAKEHLASVIQKGTVEEIDAVRHKLRRAELRVEVAARTAGAAVVPGSSGQH